MTDPWTLVVAIGAATILLRGAGPLVLGARALPPRAMGAIELLPPALLAALVATLAFGGDRALVLDERAVGLTAATAALLLHAPLLVVVVAAAMSTAGARGLM